MWAWKEINEQMNSQRKERPLLLLGRTFLWLETHVLQSGNQKSSRSEDITVMEGIERTEAGQGTIRGL